MLRVRCIMLLLALALMGLLMTQYAHAASEEATGSCGEEEGGVGSSVMHEDDAVKVWDMRLEPGEASSLHTHDMNYTFVVLNGSTIEVTGAEGEHLLTFTAKEGESLSFDLQGDYLIDASGRFRIHKTHRAKNVGAGLFREVLIEKKR